MRELASVQKIVSIEPIPNADAIEKATVLGWECVIAKSDNYQVGDLVVYIEIDSIVPDIPAFGFMQQRRFRVRTIKLRKQVSQGLVMPLSILPEGKKYREGQDVTKILGIIKYDPEGDKERRLAEQKAANEKNKIKRFLMRYPWYRRLFVMRKRNSWPSFIKKTDEERIQKIPYICENEAKTKFEVTEKIDGQSATYFLVRRPKFKFFGIKFGKELVFGVCSRNLWLPKKDNSSWWTVAEQLNIESVLRYHIKPEHNFIVLQGEIIGEGIQDNKYGIKGYDFYAFNFFTNKTRYNNVEMFGLNYQGVKTVPLLKSEFNLLPTVPAMVEYAIGQSTIANVKREGIVVRNYDKNISFKVINPDFLLKYGE